MHNLIGFAENDLLYIIDLLISGQIYAQSLIKSSKKRFAPISLYWRYRIYQFVN